MLLFFACKQGKSDASEKISEVKITSDNSNQTDILQLIEDLNLVPLETGNNCLVGKVRMLKTDGNQLYLLEYNDNPIKVFSKDGKFVSEIGHKGSGPGEFIQMCDFLPDKDTVSIFAWSGNKKWIRYSMNNQLLYETNMSFPFDMICPIENNRYLAYVSNGTVSAECDYYLYCIDKKFEVQSRKDPKTPPKDIPLHVFQNHFCQNSGFLSYMKDYCDTIYSISHDLDIRPKYHLDFGKNWYSKGFLEKYHNKSVFEIYNAIDQNKYVKFINFHESNEHLIIGYTIRQDDKKDCKYISIHFKDTGNTFNFKEKPSNDVLANLMMRPYYVRGNQFLSLISAEDLLDMASKIESDDDISKKVKRYAKQIDMEDNPIVVLFSLKKL
jgi:hypothetical protein